MTTTMWAWGLGWALASAGLTFSDIFSSPNQGLGAAVVLGLAGWTIGSVGTIRDLRRRGDASQTAQVLCGSGWVVGASVSLYIIATGLPTLRPGFLALIAGPAVGGAIGGAVTGLATTPPSQLSSGPVRRAADGAVCWGAGFLVFSFVSFYAGYILAQMTVDPLVPIVGHAFAKVPGLALPAGLCGVAAARIGGMTLYPAR